MTENNNNGWIDPHKLPLATYENGRGELARDRIVKGGLALAGGGLIGIGAILAKGGLQIGNMVNNHSEAVQAQAEPLETAIPPVRIDPALPAPKKFEPKLAEERANESRERQGKPR